ncbi:mechanosensitive ion channel [Candidatus Mycosynbacter amalyticus]|uniref:Mechanosensitive ion channel n=2 Tax=Candidatus Mycosynbacter amalyticus TaxID=2665156 RepID=A0A857MN11_9BACT|nr:mechanosensitive ion channel [Candidatus Mycosynbacter amalyticus]
MLSVIISMTTLGDMEQFNSIDWDALHTVLVKNTLVQVLLTIITTLILLIIVQHSIGVLVRRSVRGHRYASKIDEHKREQTLQGILRTSVGVIIWIIAALVILTQLGFQLSTLLTSAGLIGVVVGFGAQNVIKDFVAGLFVLGENQYRVGDVVEMQVAGIALSGTVEDLTVRITRLRDLDGNLHIIGNGAAQAVTNLSYKYANVNIDVDVAYASDIDDVEEIINEVGQKMAKSDTWSRSIFEPIQFLRVDDLTDTGVRIKALGRVEPAEQWAVAGEFRRRLKKEFDKRGVVFAGAPAEE